MSDIKNPLIHLLGTWEGNRGTDLAPKPEEDENNPYYETLIIEAVDIDIENAEKQQLYAVQYKQEVREKSNDDISHSETGYWIWDKNEDTIMCAFAIPRGVTVLAGGRYLRGAKGEITMSVSSSADGANFGINQSPFMAKKALTKSFRRELKLNGNSLSYEQTSELEIYGKAFSHKDNNTLTKK